MSFASGLSDDSAGMLTIDGFPMVSSSDDAILIRLARELEALRTRVSGLEAENAALAMLADQDAYLPVANRRAFLRELSRRIAYGRRHNSPASVLYIDLNGMKQINDHFGHAAGDAVLAHVAHSLVAQLRREDVVARLGGDEFGILLVATPQAGAEQKAASLAASIEASPLIWNGVPIPISAAIGSHELGKNEDSEQVIAAADLAMYRIKHARRLAQAPDEQPMKELP